jgi:hypothetical protein
MAKPVPPQMSSEKRGEASIDDEDLSALNMQLCTLIHQSPHQVQSSAADAPPEKT